ncbi:MAG: redoxin family protein [Nitrososphaerota archaeon]|jgi:cytochrome oxidase Cu insertion factor (SCO1/SenC/PrrC family)|nr:redoxin family protein [Nitrososphaerota archaeon]
MPRCEKCDKNFSSEAALHQHNVSKHPESLSLVKNKSSLKKDSSRVRTKRLGKKTKQKIILIGVLAVIVSMISLGAIALSNNHHSDSAGGVGINVGDVAPNIPLYLTNGSSVTLDQFVGHKVLLWFITTWCPGCQQGADLLATQFYSQLRAEGVIVLTVESYNDLGYSGPTINQFAEQYAGGSSTQGWLFATTTQSATYTYNPQADLDIYYLINPDGTIVTGGANMISNIQSILSSAS